jgi:hypothetical protein
MTRPMPTIGLKNVSELMLKASTAGVRQPAPIEQHIGGAWRSLAEPGGACDAEMMPWRVRRQRRTTSAEP